MANTLQELKGQKAYSGAVTPPWNHRDDYVYANEGDFMAQNKPRGIIDLLRGATGFYSRADEFNDQLRLRQLEHDQQLETMEYENFYNSPSQQAMRMRAAGLNPDLQGLSGVSEASSYNEPEQGLGIPQSDEPNLISLASSVVGLASTAQSLISAGVNIMRDKESLRGLKVDNLKKFYETAGDIYMKIHGPADEGPEKNHEDNYVTMYNLARDIFGRGRMARKVAEHFNRAFNNYQGSYEGETKRYDSRTRLAKSRQELASVVSSPAYSDSDKEIVEALEPITTAEYEVAKLGLDVQQRFLEWKQKYFGTSDPELVAGAENARNETDLSKSQFEINKYENLDGGLFALSENARQKYFQDFYDNLSGSLGAKAENAKNAFQAMTQEDQRLMLQIRHKALTKAYEKAQEGGLFSQLVFAVVSQAFGQQQFALNNLSSLLSVGH